jgi:xanthine permease XanP
MGPPLVGYVTKASRMIPKSMPARSAIVRPANILYGTAEKPPRLVCLLSAVQQIAILSPTLAYPILALQAAGASSRSIASGVSLALVAVGLGTALQSFTFRYLGSGYLITFANSGAYYPVTAAAASLGGMPLVAGMTLIAGATEVALGQIVRRFRSLFPAEISGLCILLIGVIIGLLGLRLIFGLNQIASAPGAADAQSIALGCGTFALMVGLNVWSRGALRMYCAIIGIIAGYAAGIAVGNINADANFSLGDLAIVAWPIVPSGFPSFRAELVIPFAITGLACCLRAMGDITNAQRINDQDWVRPEMTSLRNGITADGAATILSAAIGGLGGNTFSASVGLASATGVAARVIGIWMGAILVVLSIFPAVAWVLVAAPPPVLGATLIFNSCFIVSSGLQIITSRLLDARKTFIIGIALLLSLSRDIFPGLYLSFPDYLQPFVSSDLTIGVLPALVLNALFRIGITRRQKIALASAANGYDSIRVFLEQQGARWGARRNIVERAIFGTAQACESIAEHCNAEGPITIEASFDEFNLDVRLTYQGDPLTLEESRPSVDEIVDSEEGMRRLAGFLLKRNADSVRTYSTGNKSVIEFRFQH